VYYGSGVLLSGGVSYLSPGSLLYATDTAAGEASKIFLNAFPDKGFREKTAGETLRFSVSGEVMHGGTGGVAGVPAV
jgi:hypothetical protein